MSYKRYWIVNSQRIPAEAYQVVEPMPLWAALSPEYVELAALEACQKRLEEACELLKDVGPILRYRSSMPDPNEQNLFLKIDTFLAHKDEIEPPERDKR